MVASSAPILSEDDAVEIQEYLLRFLRGQRTPEPDEIAQEALFRVLNKLKAGLAIRNPLAYARQVAQHVIQENRRKGSRETSLKLDILAPIPSSSREQLLECLEACQRRALSRAERKLLRTFDESNANGRDRIAQKMGISRNALGLRIHQLRSKLRACVETCMKEGRAK